jgi:uncharacterized protein (TIGR00369 family)
MTQPTLEQLRATFRRAPFIADLGIELESLGGGECTTSLAVQQRHLQQDGFVHAGVQATMADHTAGAAASTLAPEGRLVLTAEFSVKLLRPARGERLVCRASVLKPGSQLVFIESEVYAVTAGREFMVAKASATMVVVEPRVRGGDR